MLQYFLYPEKFMLLNITMSWSLLNIVIGVCCGWGLTLIAGDKSGFKKNWITALIIWLILEIVCAAGLSETVLMPTVSAVLFSHLPKLSAALISSIPIWTLKHKNNS